MNWTPLTASEPEEGDTVLCMLRGVPVVLKVAIETPSYEETFTPFKVWVEPHADMLAVEWLDVTEWAPITLPVMQQSNPRGTP